MSAVSIDTARQLLEASVPACDYGKQIRKQGMQTLGKACHLPTVASKIAKPCFSDQPSHDVAKRIYYKVACCVNRAVQFLSDTPATQSLAAVRNIVRNTIVGNSYSS